MTQAVVQVRNIVDRTGFANPLTLEVLVTDEDYLKVYADDELLDNGADYEITGIGDPNGVSIEIIGAEDVDTYLGVETFTALYDPPLDQLGNLAAGGVLGRAFESALDQQNRRLQALGDKVKRAVKLPVDIAGDQVTDAPVDGTVPVWNDTLQRVIWTALSGQYLVPTAADLPYVPTPPLTADNVQEAIDEVALLAGNITEVSTRGALKALDPTAVTIAHLTENGRDGVFVLRAGTVPYADAQEGALLVSTTSDFYWERVNYRVTGVCPQWFGAVDSDPAQSITGLNAAWDFSRVAGVPLIVPIGTWYGRGLALYSNQQVVGMDMFRSIIKKPDATNTDDVIFGQDSYSLFGTTPANPDIVGSHQWRISNLTVDCNFRGNASASRCLSVWGRRWTMENVMLRDAGSHGLVTEFTDSGAIGGMEAVMNNVIIDTAQFHGWLNQGPHDMMASEVVMVDVGQAANDTWDGMHVSTGGNGRFVNMHVWQRGASANRARYGLNVTALGGLCSFVNSHFEGAYSANVMCAQPYCSFDAACGFYAAWNGVNVVLKASYIALKGWLGPPGAGRPSSLGIKLGEGSGDTVSGCLVDVVAVSQDAGEIDATYSDGGNVVRVTGTSAASPHVVGTPPITDHLYMNVGSNRDTYLGGSIFQQVDGAGVSSVVRAFLTSVGSGALQLQRGRGTGASPAAVLSGDRIGAITFGGQYDTTVGHMANAAAVIGYAAENFSGSAQGGRIAFETTPNTSTTRAERWGVEQNGMLKATSGSLSRGAPVTKSADFTVADNETWLLNNKGSACVVTLPSAASFPGRELYFTNIGGAFALTSNASNVVPKAGGSAGTAILAATDGVWATLVSDGTNWIIMQAGT